MIVKINFQIILLLVALISYKIPNIDAATKVEQYRPLSAVKGADQSDEVTTKGLAYSANKMVNSMQKNHDDVESLRSNIKESSSKTEKFHEPVQNLTTKPTESAEENESLNTYRTPHSSNKNNINKNLKHFTVPKNTLEQNQQKMYSIKLPNQNFHNQAMQLNADYQGYITHDSPIFVQHPNHHLSEATRLHFGSSIPSNFDAHFEALTQHQEKPKEYPIRGHHQNTPLQIKALSGNYYNTNVQHYDNKPNNNLPQFDALQGTHYGSNIQHDEQIYSNNDKPVQYGMTVTHNGKPQNHPFFQDEYNQKPRFEALTDNHQQHTRPPTSDHVDNGYKKHKTYFNNESESRLSSQKPDKLEQNQHSLPNQAVLLDHKIYHDDNYQRSDNQNSGPQNIHQSYRSNVFKPSAQAFTFNNKGFNQQIGQEIQNNKPKKHLKSSRHHHKHDHSPNKNNGYLTNEQPEESQISQKNILPLIPKPEKTLQKFYINIENETLNRKLLDDRGNKSHIDYLKSKIPPGTDKNKTIDNKFHEEDYDDFKENNDREIIKPVHEDFEERDASPKQITNEIRYFQDIYLAHRSPHETEFGHVLETPENIEERFESNDRKNHRYKGKIQWTNKDGEFGQQYWDLGHLGGK